MKFGDGDRRVYAIYDTIEDFKIRDILNYYSEDEDLIISITQNIALNREELEKICKLRKNITLNIYYAENANTGFAQSKIRNRNDHLRYGIHLTKNSYLFNEEESKIFVDNCNYIKSKYGCEITINYNFTVEEAVNASNRVNKWAEQINNAEVNGEKLTPYEKYLWAFQIVNSFVYKLSNNDTGNNKESREVVSVLNSDTIVCAGYAELLSELCYKIGINCQSRFIERHAICTIDMVDPKYNIDGIYISNPTRSDMTPAPQRLSDIDLSSSLWTYEQANKWIKETKLLDDDCYYHYQGRENDILKLASDEIMKLFNEEYNILFKSHALHRSKQRDSNKSWIHKLIKKFDKTSELQNLPDDEQKNNHKKQIYEIIRDFNRTTNIEKFRSSIKTLLTDEEFGYLSYEDLVGYIQEYLETVDVDDPNTLRNIKTKYILDRKKKSKLPNARDIITAYKKILIAQGILEKDAIDSEIENVLDSSSYDALPSSLFLRNYLNGKGKSEIEEEFDNIRI